MSVICHGATAIVLRAGARIAVEILLDEAGLADAAIERNVKRQRLKRLSDGCCRGGKCYRGSRFDQSLQAHRFPEYLMTFATAGSIS